MEEMLGWLIGERLGRRRLRRRALRQQAEGIVEASIRVTSGQVPGLSGQWLPGAWTVAPGRLTLWHTTVKVDSVRPERRAPSRRESWNVHPNTWIFVATSGSAEIELAVASKSADWTISRLVAHVDQAGKIDRPPPGT